MNALFTPNLQNKRFLKFRRNKGKNLNLSTRGVALSFGTYGLKAITSGFITSYQIEAVRRTIARKLKKVGKLWINIFPNQAITKKSAGIRMGKGKGPIDHWAIFIKQGRVLFEISGVPYETAKNILIKSAMKLPVRTKFVNKSYD